MVKTIVDKKVLLWHAKKYFRKTFTNAILGLIALLQSKLWELYLNIYDKVGLVQYYASSIYNQVLGHLKSFRSNPSTIMLIYQQPFKALSIFNMVEQSLWYQ